MKTIRRGTFETNSSSTHTIVVPKKVNEDNWDMSDSLEHNYEYGREESRLVDRWDEKLAYLYIVLKDFNEWPDGGRDFKPSIEGINSFKTTVNRLYNEVKKIVKYKPSDYDPKPNDIFDYIDSEGKEKMTEISFSLWDNPYPYVDHCHGLDDTGFLERILSDEQFLKRFIFNRSSYITVGGDEYRGYNVKTIGFEYDYDDAYYYVNKDGERPPEEWFDENGCIKDEHWDEYTENYNDKRGGFWDKLEEYKKDNDVFLKGC